MEPEEKLKRKGAETETLSERDMAEVGERLSALLQDSVLVLRFPALASSRMKTTEAFPHPLMESWTTSSFGVAHTVF